MDIESIKYLIKARSDLFKLLVANNAFLHSLVTTGEAIVRCLKSGGKILIFGNGGSATQAQHFAAELVCKFEKSRRALPAIALTADTSILTAVGNDYDFRNIFSRQLEALCKSNDIAIGLTTSDFCFETRHSLNIYGAFITARNLEATTVGLFSSKTVNLLRYNNFPDFSIIIPETDTALIQEGHQFVIHALCKIVDEAF